MNETIKDQLQKIARLAECGFGGERDNAKAMLDRLCRKHGVSAETLLSPETQLYRFSYSGPGERSLLFQCFFFVLQRTEATYSKARASVWFRLTEAERIDLRACWTHYRKAWRAYLKEAEKAFIVKHRIFGPSSGEPGAPMDPALLARILAMARGVGGESWARPAAALNA